MSICPKPSIERDVNFVTYILADYNVRHPQRFESGLSANGFSSAWNSCCGVNVR